MAVKTIKRKFDKADLQSLPRVLFGGRVIVVISQREVEQAVRYLMRQPLLGFDTETRPSFKRGTHYKVALMQVSTPDTCFLFRLNRIGLPDELVALLENKDVIKVGLSLKDDIMMLHHRRDFKAEGFLDLQDEVKRIGVEDMSLQKIYANLLGGKISKTQQLTNWEADALTTAQQLYAATDAWTCILLHEEIARLVRTGDYTLE